ncbi:VanW family protein [Anaeroselena agilis]|uniref:VanW family protein n=1 Tax=Anaeroselena agilis TaxID=3063788 RepID=A0ABU3P3L8_9FIRM|nr:VanW family protein [Selenomonadales bacterium 4137-cl]
MTRKSRLAAATAIIVFALAAVLVRPLVGGGVYEGVAVEGVAVGGLGRDELGQLLAAWRQEYHSRHVVVYYGDTAFRLDAASIDYDLDVEATAEEAWAYGRRGSWGERLKNIGAARREGYRIPLRVRYNENKLAALLEAWREAIDRPPRNAALSLEKGGIVPQEQGRRLDVAAVKPLVLKALHAGDANLPLPVTPLYPDVTVADLRQTGIKELWSSFTTAFDPADANRTANIRLSARRINGHIVYPGETFSFNQVVGPRDREHGFKEALEIVDGEFVPGIGGGVCQVSSTLYNAVLLANLTVVERSNHSKPLGYVGLGRDATVVFGALDFKFANNTGSPVVIMAETAKNRLTVGIVGREPLAVAVELLSADRQVIPPAVVKKQDPGLFLGETKVDKQGKPGYEVTTLRVVSAGGRELKREVLTKDRYQPENTIVKVGTKLPPFVQEKIDQVQGKN